MTNTDPNVVGAYEHGKIRVYSIGAMSADAFNAFTQVDYTTDEDVAPWPLMDALGADFLDEDFIEIHASEDLALVGGLSNYLVQSNEVPATEVDPNKDLLDGQGGYLLLVFSSAFKGKAQTLSPRTPLHFVACLNEAPASVTFTPLPTEGAEGVIGDTPMKKKPSDAAMSGRIATLALLVMFLLVALMIWVAG